MIRKLALALVLALMASIIVGGFSARATTCRRVVITILDDPYFAHPICTDLPLPIESALEEILPPGDVSVSPGR